MQKELLLSLFAAFVATACGYPARYGIDLDTYLSNMLAFDKKKICGIEHQHRFTVLVYLVILSKLFPLKSALIKISVDYQFSMRR